MEYQNNKKINNIYHKNNNSNNTGMEVNSHGVVHGEKENKG